MSWLLGRYELPLWPQISVVIFLALFVALVAVVYRPARKRGYEAASRMPLDDDNDSLGS